MRRSRVGLADNWLRHVQDVHEKHQHSLVACDSETAAADRLCELNVIEQVANVCQTTIARDAWERGQELSVHGWIYGIADGLARDLNTTVSDFRERRPFIRQRSPASHPRAASGKHERAARPGARRS
jgi:carbonic anhydrase